MINSTLKTDDRLTDELIKNRFMAKAAEHSCIYTVSNSAGQYLPGKTPKKVTLVCLRSHIPTLHLDLRHSFGAIYHHDREKSYIIVLKVSLKKTKQRATFAFREVLQMQSCVRKILAQKCCLTHNIASICFGAGVNETCARVYMLTGHTLA